MPTYSSDHIVDAVLAGVANARHTYAAWTSDGGYFAWAPEYLITVSVARMLWECCPPLTVWPEYRLTDAMREAGLSDRQARAGHLDGNRRADLLLYREKSRPHAIVEIKRNVEGWGRIAADVERMRALVAGAESSFEMGVVAFNCTLIGGPDGRGMAVLQERLARMSHAASSLHQPGWRCSLMTGDMDFDGHEYWSAAAIVLERSRPKRLPLAKRVERKYPRPLASSLICGE